MALLHSSSLSRRTVATKATANQQTVVVAQPVRRPAQQQQQQHSPVQRLGNAAAAAALGVSLCLVPMGCDAARAAAQPQQLADLLREEFGFVDSDKDGLISKSELQSLVKNVSTEANLPLVEGDQLDFSMKLFDLNQDGKLTTEELLRALVLDGAVAEDAVDADVYNVFDRNANGTIEQEEFRAGLGDVGSNGDAAKDFVYGRVDRLSDSGGHLNSSAFGNALVLMRAVLLGY
uniref:EF-hand domain-containing protein n=1 Tax=Tetradesmus obliquus TaxID=3088 RepID=A0A383V5T2_TETOB|eukprot:jgi/Sobl393_1/3967/SZX60461.1